MGLGCCPHIAKRTGFQSKDVSGEGKKDQILPKVKLIVQNTYRMSGAVTPSVVCCKNLKPLFNVIDNKRCCQFSMLQELKR